MSGTNITNKTPMEASKPLKKNVRTFPIVIKQENQVKAFNHLQVLMKNLKSVPGSTIYQEDVIYEKERGDFVGETPVKTIIVNRLDILRNKNRTILRCEHDNKLLSESTSDNIVRCIGQSNYDIVLSALCSISNKEIKAKAIMALLQKATVEDGCVQTDNLDSDSVYIINDSNRSIKLEKPVTEEKCCQTDENCMDIIYKLKQKKRVKRSVLTPYAIKDNPKVIKKVIINPHRNESNATSSKEKDPLVPTNEDLKLNEAKLTEKDNEISDLPVIQLNDESVDNFSMFSGSICSDILHNTEQFFESVVQHTEEPKVMETPYYIYFPDKSFVQVSVKPEYPFHMATPEILNGVHDDVKQKIVAYQAYLDFKLCLNKDADGYLPIHNAVLSNDVDLLRRQCVVLRYRQQSLDITAGNLTALQMAISQDLPQCTALLLQLGADPLFTDEEQHRTSLHLASLEGSSDHLVAIVNHCEGYAKDILEDYEEWWKDEYQNKSKMELAAILLKHACAMWDSQGYTPLMLAAISGNYAAVKILAEASRHCVNLAMPNSGNTALYLAVYNACLDASKRHNKSKVADHYQRTIMLLLENGADISIPNYAGTTVSDLLKESSNSELSMLFANKVTASYFDGSLPSGSQFDSFMLIKNEKGDVDIAEVKKPKKIEDEEKTPAIPAPVSNRKVVKDEKKKKPVILQNISLSQSPTKIIVKPIPRNVKMINPKDVLIKNVRQIHPSKPVWVRRCAKKGKQIVGASDQKLVTLKQKEAKGKVQNITHKVVTVRQIKEGMKRTSQLLPGPSEKKPKTETLGT